MDVPLYVGRGRHALKKDTNHYSFQGVCTIAIFKKENKFLKLNFEMARMHYALWPQNLKFYVRIFSRFFENGFL